MEGELSKLFGLFQDGDRNAFSELYRRTFNQLMRYGCVICSDAGLVENITQEFFLRLLQEPEKLNHVINFKLYLFKSIRQNLLAEMEKQERRAVIRRVLADPDVTDVSREEQMMEEEAKSMKINWLQKQLSALPPRQKEVVYLRFYEGFPYQKIAQLTSLTEQVARNYVAKALSRMRGNLGELAI